MENSTTEVLLKVKTKFDQQLKYRFSDKIKVIKIVTGVRFTKYFLNLPTSSLDELKKYKADFAVLTEKCSNIEFSIENEMICIYVQNEDFNEKQITFSNLVCSKEYENCNMKLPIAFGKDFAGRVVVKDLRDLGYLMCVGVVGSWIAELMENMVLSLSSKYLPDDLKLMLIEPKNFNLRKFDVFENLPHLLGGRVFKEPEDILDALDAVTGEINRRYEIFSDFGAPNIETYNASNIVMEDSSKKMPYVVIFVSKFDNVISIDKKKIERILQIITSRAKACGIMLVISTEKPTIDVLTNVVINHIHSKLTFNTKKISANYMTIIPESENLFSHGDMLLLPYGEKTPLRLQSGYIDFSDCKKIADQIAENYKG